MPYIHPLCVFLDIVFYIYIYMLMKKELPENKRSN